MNEADGYGDSQVADPLNTRYAEVYRGGGATALRRRPAGQGDQPGHPHGQGRRLRHPATAADRRRLVRPGPQDTSPSPASRETGTRLCRRHQPDRPRLCASRGRRCGTSGSSAA
ncbi:hypothetical protein ACRAWD_24030 [Caulobacter segnis]